MTPKEIAAIKRELKYARQIIAKLPAWKREALERGREIEERYFAPLPSHLKRSKK